MDQRVKILFLQGPSGSGKNSMIDCFGQQYNYEVVRYRDERTNNVYDVFGMQDEFENQDNFERFYPDDLMNLMGQIRTIFKQSMKKVGQGAQSSFAPPKVSSFSSFSNKSTFAKKSGN